MSVARDVERLVALRRRRVERAEVALAEARRALRECEIAARQADAEVARAEEARTMRECAALAAFDGATISARELIDMRGAMRALGQAIARAQRVVAMRRAEVDAAMRKVGDAASELDESRRVHERWCEIAEEADSAERRGLSLREELTAEEESLDRFAAGVR